MHDIFMHDIFMVSSALHAYCTNIFLTFAIILYLTVFANVSYALAKCFSTK